MVDPIFPRGQSRIATTTTQRAGSRDATRVETRDTAPPPRPRNSFIPTPDVLDDLIQRAVAALRRGVYWERGSIINILL